MSFTSPYHRSQQHHPSAIKALYHVVNNLLFGEADHFLPGLKAVGIRCPGKQQAHEIVNLRNGTHGRPGILVGSFLLNGNNRTQSFNFFHIGPLHIAYKLLGIGAEGFHVAALPFSINGIKRQRALATAAYTRNHHQAVAWNADIHVAQVVFTRTPDFQVRNFRI